ncbi:MAG: isoprenylcysteine carboxylmethyltransferase family protein [candidate division Zixibacteria bacterium]
MLQYKIIIFIVVSAGILWLSRNSLRNFRSHGFYRFFAWEAILIIIILNFRHWFENPLSINQLISWFLLIACTVLVIVGTRLLITIGKPNSNRDDPTLYGIEKTTKLVTVGAYRYIRHPIYSSLLFLTWGAFFKHISIITICLALIATLFLFITAKFEESENIKFFGDDYREYMKRTKMFVPYLF